MIPRFLVTLLFLLLPVSTFASVQSVKIYSNSGDGRISTAPYPAQWSIQTSSNLGRAVNYTGDVQYAAVSVNDNNSGLIEIGRSFLSFDTSVLPDEAVILDTKLALHVTKTDNDFGDEQSYIALYRGRQISTETLVQSDINKCGEIDGSNIELSARIYPETIDLGINSFQLNQLGIDSIDVGGQTKFCLRAGHDVENIEPFASDPLDLWETVSLHFNTSEAPGTSTDPYLEITYMVPDEPENEVPLYTQIVSPHPSIEETSEWADDKFARAMSDNAIAGCETIAKCGCAITSLIMMARAEEITEGVDGSVVNPGNFNTWLIEHNGYNIYGGVNWGRALDYFGVETGSVIATPFELDHHNSVSDLSVQSYAANEDEYVIGFSDQVSSGHYFVVSDYEAGEYTVRDPWYYNTENLDDDSEESFVHDYGNNFTKANLFSFGTSDVLSGFLEISLASPAELRLSNEAEEVTGYTEEGLLQEIESSSYDQHEMISDPGADPGQEYPIAKRMVVTEAAGVYVLEVEGTDAGHYTLGISLHDITGKYHHYEFVTDTAIGLIDRYLIDMNTGSVTHAPIELSDINALIDGLFSDLNLNRFFKHWSGKIFGEINAEKFAQAAQHIETFKTLMDAKKAESDTLYLALQRLEMQLQATSTE